ncbi:MAG: site-specific DNA-methyltransferase [Anaerolineales bacterium]|nr:site-specific DNA-methyltransferase [Anaerolineales bacterium]
MASRASPAAATAPASALPLDQVLLGDCLQVLAGFPEKSVDLVFADPPYNLQLQNELWRPDQTRVDAVDDAWDRFESFAAYDAFTQAWLTACRRVLKDNGTIWVMGTYHNIYRVGRLMQDMGFWILNDVVWVKDNPMPNFRGVRFTNAQETLIWAQKVRGARYTFNYHAMKALNGDVQMRSDWRLPLCSGKERLRLNGAKAHAAQKPEALLYRVILASTHSGDVVLDPFFGTGTSGAVARRLGRHWIGVEVDPEYVQLARQRIAAVEPGEAEALGERPRQAPRLPFGVLLESGLLQPGQELYFGPRRQAVAVVLANGHLHCNGLSGSIHQVGRALQGAPCNGWEHWYYHDPATGQLEPIDRLRQRLRLEGAGAAGEQSSSMEKL